MNTGNAGCWQYALDTPVPIRQTPPIMNNAFNHKSIFTCRALNVRVVWPMSICARGVVSS